MTNNVSKIMLLLSVLAPTLVNAAPQLTLGSIQVLQAQTGYLTLRLTGGTEPYAGINAAITLPAGVSSVGISRAALASGSNFVSDIQTNGNIVKVLVYSGYGVFAGADGTVLRLHLRAAPNATPGIFPVTFASANPVAAVNSRHALANADGSQSLAHTTIDGSITILADADRDGIADSWELARFGSLTQASATSDYDGDGLSDLDEYRAGTDPRNPASYFWVEQSTASAVSEGATEFRLSWTPVEGALYGIDRSFDFLNWSRVRINIEATPPLNTIADSVTAPQGSAFYRLVLLQGPTDSILLSR